MPRRAFIPPELKARPFTLAEARAAGLSWRQLQGASWRRVGFQTYVWAGLPEHPLLALAGAAVRVPGGSMFACLTAAWLNGHDVPPTDPITVVVPEGLAVSDRAGLRVLRRAIDPEDMVVVAGFRATSVLRTLADLAVELPLVEAVVMADEALRKGLTRLSALSAYAKARAGRRGAIALREVVLHAEPKAESPMETRLRIAIVTRGLPRPEAQPTLRDSWGRFICRPDLFYREQRLALEYDGGTHRDSLVEDNRRQNRMTNAGIRVLRFTYADVMHHPDDLAAAVAKALRSTTAA